MLTSKLSLVITTLAFLSDKLDGFVRRKRAIPPEEQELSLKEYLSEKSESSGSSRKRVRHSNPRCLRCLKGFHGENTTSWFLSAVIHSAHILYVGTLGRPGRRQRRATKKGDWILHWE